VKTITPTLAICVSALFGGAALLALPADPPSAVDSNPSSGVGVPASNDLMIESFTFQGPSVAAGAMVSIVNRDDVVHTVTADLGAFDITIGPGATATFGAPSIPGTYTYTCVVHPSMAGSIAVT
jgi:plastocyanin